LYTTEIPHDKLANLANGHLGQLQKKYTIQYNAHIFIHIYTTIQNGKEQNPYLHTNTFIHTLLFIYTYTFKTSLHTYIRYNVKCIIIIIIIMYYEYVPSI